MERVSGPLGPRRRIATTLKRLREESDQNLTDVARELLISTSKLSRLENAQGKPRLARYPGPDPALRDRGDPGGGPPEPVGDQRPDAGLVEGL